MPINDFQKDYTKCTQKLHKPTDALLLYNLSYSHSCTRILEYLTLNKSTLNKITTKDESFVLWKLNIISRLPATLNVSASKTCIQSAHKYILI